MGRGSFSRRALVVAISAASLMVGGGAALVGLLASAAGLLQVSAPDLLDPRHLGRLTAAAAPGGLDVPGELVPQTEWGTLDDPGCPAVATTTWTVDEIAYTSVRLTQCVLESAAFGALDRLAAPGPLTPDEREQVWRWQTADRLGRAWVQNSSLIEVTTTCRLTWDCDFWNDSVVFDVIYGLPGRSSPAEPADGDVTTEALRLGFSILVALLVVVGAVRLAQRLRAERLPAVADRPGWLDLTAAGDRVTWLTRARSFAIVTAVVLTPVGLVPTDDEWNRVGAALYVGGGLAFGVVAWWADRTVKRWLGRRPPPAVARTRSVRRGVGEGLVAGARLLVVAAWLLVGLLAVAVVTLGPGSPAPAVAAIGVLGPSSGQVAALALGMLAAITGEATWWAIGPLAIGTVVPVVLLAVGINHLGRRLVAPSIVELRAADPLPPLLLLRSFGDDATRLPALHPRHSALPSLLRLGRGRRFEEVLADILAGHGPLIAVNPPGMRLPSLGAAKESLANDEWRSRVDELMGESGIAVFLCTPDSMNPGLAWELQNAANRLEPARLLLVVGPYPAAEVAARWDRFARAAVAVGRSFAGLAELRLLPGAHVLVWTGGRWVQVGARVRQDISYELCLTEALRLSAG